MAIYQMTEAPLALYGIDYRNPEQEEYWRLHPEIMEKMPQYQQLGRRSCGGRVRFATDAPEVVIRYRLKTLSVDSGMGLPGSAGIDCYLGVGREARFAGMLRPTDYLAVGSWLEYSITKEIAMEVVTINLPRNEELAALEVEIPSCYQVQKAPYIHEKPIIFYGSSITEGGCSSRPGVAYTSMVARWLDSDYRNFGFSGSAKGELDFAEYISVQQEMSLLVYDYDHNAPTPEHLRQTHEAFFLHIRNQHPELPVIMLSRPDFKWEEDDDWERRRIIYATFQNAIRRGDRKVWFVDGEQFFSAASREECTVDGCHPNTLGFYQMAERLYPMLHEILKRTERE